MKRKGLVALMLIITLLSTGCNVSQTELTKEENDMIAEYVAGVLLRYDLRYQHKLIYETEEESTVESPSPDTGMTPGPTTEPTEQPDTSIDTPDDAQPQQEYQTLAQIYENKDCTVEYISVKEYTSYPKTSEQSYFRLKATDNNKLLVLTFKITNKSEEKNTFSLIDSGIAYRLEDSQGYTEKPLLTALTNDLQYLDIEAASGESKNAVVVFEIPENADKSGYTLYVTRDDMIAKVALA